jgi:tRNA:m4X modification enzyme
MDIRHCFLPNLPGVNPVYTYEADEETALARIRSNEKGKKNGDSTIQNGTENGQKMEINDQKMEINEQKMETLGETGQKRVVVIAKHLCGVATDLALRSLTGFSLDEAAVDSDIHPKSSEQERLVNAVRRRVRGVAIATCCHHACNWDDYTGREWLASLQNGLNISREEFDVLRLWSGWAHTLRTGHHRRKQESDSGSGDIEEAEAAGRTEEAVRTGSDGGDNMDNEDDTNTNVDDHKLEGETAASLTSVMRPSNITYEGMAATGSMVKKIFDYGRMMYLRGQLDMSADYVQYCEPCLSPECMMILARNK